VSLLNIQFTCVYGCVGVGQSSSYVVMGIEEDRMEDMCACISYFWQLQDEGLMASVFWGVCVVVFCWDWLSHETMICWGAC
jgi:hypothetical protein